MLLSSTTTKGSLKEKGVRLTRQRELLLELIDKTGLHLDAERLFQMAKEQDPKLNRVTVYRTLKMLKQGGLVDELDLMHHGGDQHYYETRTKQEQSAAKASARRPGFPRSSTRLRRLQALVRQAHVILGLQQAGYQDVLVDSFPVNADASTNELPLRPLLRGGVKKSREPRQRHRDRPPII